MEKEFIELVNALVTKYNSYLNDHDINCKIHKHFVCSPVYNRILGADTIPELVEEALTKKSELKHKNSPNRYYLLAIQISPLKAKANTSLEGKQYAFLVAKTERVYKGVAPKTKIYCTDKVLKAIERRLYKISIKAQKRQTNSWCYNSFLDTFRYSYNKKYGYIKKVMGKSRSFWITIWTLIILFPIILATTFALNA